MLIDKQPHHNEYSDGVCLLLAVSAQSRVISSRTLKTGLLFQFKELNLTFVPHFNQHLFPFVKIM
jgi:hypothetical protein